MVDVEDLPTPDVEEIDTDGLELAADSLGRVGRWRVRVAGAVGYAALRVVLALVPAPIVAEGVDVVRQMYE